MKAGSATRLVSIIFINLVTIIVREFFEDHLLPGKLREENVFAVDETRNRKPCPVGQLYPSAEKI
jgi:hypothetical protein